MGDVSVDSDGEVVCDYVYVVAEGQREHAWHARYQHLGVP
jgi:hypothetical protein